MNSCKGPREGAVNSWRGPREAAVGVHSCCGCGVPPVVLGQVGQDVHLLVLLQQAVRRADVVVLQHRPVVVQDGRVRPAGTRTASVSQRGLSLLEVLSLFQVLSLLEVLSMLKGLSPFRY